MGINKLGKMLIIQRENGVDEQQHTENLTKNLHNDKTISEENHHKPMI
ncbi:hypothetical protein ACVPOW_11805 [Staphylococcus aureus]